MTNKERFHGIDSDKGIGFVCDKLQQVLMDSTTEIQQTDDINPMCEEQQITHVEWTQASEAQQVSDQDATQVSDQDATQTSVQEATQEATQASDQDGVEWNVVYFNADLAKKEKEKKPKTKSRSKSGIKLKNDKKLSETRTTNENSSTRIEMASEGDLKTMIEVTSQKSIAEMESYEPPKPLKVKFKS